MVTVKPERIYGNWVSGIALDVHTLSSTYLGVNEAGHDVFENTRSELGELLYRLKYRGDLSAAQEIINTASAFLRPHRSKFDMLVPVPPSGERVSQPVIIVAQGIGHAIGLPVVQCISLTCPATELKGVMDRDKRVAFLQGLHSVDVTQTAGKNILLFDDVFRSGATINAIADVINHDGQPASVRVLTLTRTRSNQ
jgi:competence protein ComFC